MSGDKFEEFGLRAGRLVAFSVGEYSDYSISGAFVVLKDLCDEEMRKIRLDLITRYTQEIGSYGEAQRRFIPELIRMGYLLDVEYSEVHIGSYSDLTLSRY